MNGLVESYQLNEGIIEDLRFGIDLSAELVDYKRGEEVRLIDDSHHLASSMKRLDKYINLS